MGAGIRLRTQDVAAALAFLCAAVLGTHAFLRAHGVYGPTWSDGERRWSSRTGDEVRHAVWADPELLALEERAHDPALSADGRWLVYVVGERGLNADLFASEMRDGRPGPPERLAVCTAADELAPAFVDGWLVFASDRPGGAGGLDLWRAPWSAGIPGPVEPFEPGVNSPADETDAAAGADGLFLASNRERGLRRDFALYHARHEVDHWTLARLETLDSPFDEREPSPASDGRTLTFASDRTGGRGGFDLWRATRPTRDAATWSAPAALGELTTARDERGPWTSVEGFAMLFEGTAEDGRPVLLRARSRELVLLPPPAMTLGEWLLLASLLLTALMALLARRWRPLDILYKCLLVSILLHLLLMLYLRTVEPRSDPKDFGRDAGPAYRVRLAPAETGITQEGGVRRTRAARPAEPERERFEEALAGAAPRASLTPLDAPARAEAGAPARESLATPSPDSARPAAHLADREAPVERFEGATPALALAVPATQTARPRGAPGSVDRHPAGASGAENLPVARPNATPLAQATSVDALTSADAPGRRALRAEAAAPGTVALSAPRETFTPLAAAPGALALPAPGSEAPRSTTTAAAPERVAREPEALAGTPAPGPTEVALAAPGRADPGLPDRSARLSAPAREPLAQAVRRPGEALEPAEAAEPVPFDALDGLAEASEARRVTAALAAPERRRSTGTEVPSARPTTTALEAPSAAPLETPTPTRSSAPAVLASAIDLRAPSEEVVSPAERDTAARPFDALAALDAPRRSRSERPLAQGPERRVASAALPPVPSVAPTRAEWEAPEREAAPPPLPDRAAPRLARSAYQNRFGEQKLRALEEFGGTQETELAVARGLAYLAAIQAGDGAWGTRRDRHEKYGDVRTGKTALALLSFLGAGQLPGRPGPHADGVDRAVRWLLEHQASNGHYGEGGPYGHGIATYALAEAYALTRDEALRGPVERGVARIVATQSRSRDERTDGGWGYFFSDDHVWNRDRWPRTSVTAWQVMALESARLSGLAVPDETFDAARRFLAGAWDGRAGAFRYSHDPARLSSGYPILPASTPAALFALSLLGIPADSPELEAARRYVLVRQPDGYRYTGSDDFVHRARGNLYFWYYGTLAMFRVGGRPWEAWNAAMKATLLPAQRADGSWEPLDVYGEYAGDEDDESAYTTALCVLSLEVYYRYFTPLLQVGQDAPGAPR